jgi:2-polyprenyl-3-methyl-5-hydroxy-6-metoxy-1,4-benzoquinol methylase
LKSKRETVEPQYQHHLDLKRSRGLTRLGIEKSANWYSDPRRLAFVFSRYKFIAKMLSGKNRVLEIGCGDGFPIPIVLQEVGSVHGIDIDAVFIEDIRERRDERWPFTAEIHNMLDGPVRQAPFDAAYSLDVIEHIDPAHEQSFVRNAVKSITDAGVLIIGAPSLESQQYASPLSKVGHVNCKSGSALKALMLEYFHSVFMFCMNDEVLHTGYFPMAQYLFAVCAHKKK